MKGINGFTLSKFNTSTILLFMLFSALTFAQSNVFQVARSGSLEDIKKLYKTDENIINTVNKDGYSPLTLACYSGNYAVVSFLVNKVATINGNSKYGTPLMAAVVKGETEIVKLLLEQDADVTLVDGQGVTALHYATIFKHSEIVKLLINSGANPNLKDSAGKSAMDHATILKNEQIINILKSH